MQYAVEFVDDACRLTTLMRGSITRSTRIVIPVDGYWSLAEAVSLVNIWSTRWSHVGSASVFWTFGNQSQLNRRFNLCPVPHAMRAPLTRRWTVLTKSITWRRCPACGP